MAQNFSFSLHASVYLLLVSAVLIATSCGPSDPPALPGVVKLPAGVVPVALQKTGHGYRLLRGGKPYFLRGGAGLQHFGELRRIGGNTVRTWTTDYAEPLLDSAQQHGLTVMLGIWLEPEGSYFSYYDPTQVQAQLARVRQLVLRYRRHPALLMWNISNELELTTHSVRAYKTLNTIAGLVHELDPYHPVTISQADIKGQTANMRKYMPNIDILSVNTYGLLSTLPAQLRKSNWDGPYIVSEYGSLGHWEADSTTTWEIPFEQSSAAKAAFVRERYQQTIVADSGHCLGSYVFYWGHRFEYTDTWFSLFGATGEKTESVDELQQLWLHRYPANRAPHVTALRLAGWQPPHSVQLVAGQAYPAIVDVTDPESDSLTVRWEVLPDIHKHWTEKEVITKPEAVAGCVVQAAGRQALVRVPTKPGAYRLFVRVYDGHGSMGTANMPFLVPGPKAVAAYLSATSSD